VTSLILMHVAQSKEEVIRIMNGLQNYRPAVGGPLGFDTDIHSMAVCDREAVIAPVLPRIRECFPVAPHVELMVSFVATIPALFIALLAGSFGILADIVGYRSLLLVGISLCRFCVIQATTRN